MKTVVAPRERLSDLPACQALTAHHQQVRDLHQRQLFVDDPRRANV